MLPASLTASLVSLAATFALLLFAGPIFSLAGVLAGELVVTTRVLYSFAELDARHMSRIVVAIRPIGGRPQRDSNDFFARTSAELRTTAQVRILVADNDAERLEGEAAATVGRLEIWESYPWPLEVIFRSRAWHRAWFATHSLHMGDR